MNFRLVATAIAAGVLGGCGGAGNAPVRAAPAALETTTLQPESTPVERRLDGLIEAVNEGTVAAQTSGRVEAVLYDVNDFVPAGAVIVRIRSTEQHAALGAAQASVSEAAAREAEAQQRYQRIADMYERKVVAKASLDEATANRDAALARLNTARAALQAAQEGVSYTEVRAPYAEVVARRLVQAGETVAPGTPLISGLSLQYLRVVVDVPQSIVEQIRRIKRAAVYIADRRIEATRVTIFPEASSPSSTFRARLELPENAADLYPGMYVKVGFVTGEADQLLVPSRSVVERSEVTAVYVLDGRGTPVMRQVRLGDRIGERIEVLAGLQAGDKVALDPLAAARALEGRGDAP